MRAQTAPGEIAAQIPPRPPDAAESMEAIFADFEAIILPGVTHWQHPRFFAYFPANAAPASVIAEHLVSAMALQCMLWQTAPSATELETCMLDWLRQAVDLPLRIYATDQVHSSIDRAVWISGISAENLVRIPTLGAQRAMNPALLDAVIRRDRAAGFLPAGSWPVSVARVWGQRMMLARYATSR